MQVQVPAYFGSLIIDFAHIGRAKFHRREIGSIEKGRSDVIIKLT